MYSEWVRMKILSWQKQHIFQYEQLKWNTFGALALIKDERWDAHGKLYFVSSSKLINSDEQYWATTVLLPNGLIQGFTVL